MVFPLIPIALFVVTIVSASFAVRWIFIRLSGKRVAILGRQQVGKSTLLHFLEHNAVPANSTPTVDPERGASFAFSVHKKVIHFNVPSDLPGNDGLSFVDWKEAFSEASYVWYVFRADLIAQGDPTELDLLEEHLTLFNHWMPKKKSSGPKVILIGTWADNDPLFVQSPHKFRKLVAGIKPIDVARLKFGRMPVVVGSLLTDESAEKLVKSLGKVLS